MLFFTVFCGAMLENTIKYSAERTGVIPDFADEYRTLMHLNDILK